MWPIWNIVTAGKGTLTEIRENWSLRDIIECNYVIEMLANAEAIAMEKAEDEAEAAK